MIINTVERQLLYDFDTISTNWYLTKPMGQTMEKIKLYMYSISRYGKSPFIYPLYGLGGLPEGFSRLCAINGGTYMLNKPIAGFEYDEQGKVCGVRAADGEVAKCKLVVCDPTYVNHDPKKVKNVGKVLRCICILSNPIPGTSGASSCQIIIPQRQVNRENDIYVMLVSSSHGVAMKGKYIAIVSTTVETNDPMKEIAVALELLGPIDQQFVEVSDMWRAVSDCRDDNIYVSESFDATSHFESATQDVLRIWRNMTGEDLDLSIKADPEDMQEL